MSLKGEGDIHYFITRIINPYLNWIIVSLRSSGHIVYGRDGYTGLRWTDHSVSDRLASKLEYWRDNLWYEYKQDFPENGKKILDEFFEILVESEAKLSDDPDKKEALQGLWELAKLMGKYLDLSDYVSRKTEEVKKRASKIRERDRYLKERTKEVSISKKDKSRVVTWGDKKEEKRLSQESQKRLTLPVYRKSQHITTQSTHSNFPSHTHKRKSKRKYVVAGVVILLLIFVGYLYFQGALGRTKPAIFENQSLQGTDMDTSGYADIQTPIQTTTQVTTSFPPKTEDNDGLSFDEEQKYGTDPYNPDTDRDRIIDGDEVYKYNTNPLKADSDGDGLTDYEELFEYNTDPLDVDTDDDMLYDGIEVEKGTNPTIDDTDGDNITDAYEVNFYFTNPLSQDTDEDGLTDYAEIFTYGTNPTKEDSDGDGINDLDELGSRTDPLVEDTDNDGLGDRAELAIYHTDPLNPDSDDDNLLDGQEVLKFGTNPLEIDSDYDYLPDGYEVEIGTDPTYDWRYDYNKEAFKAGLSKLLRKEISPLAKQFEVYNTTLDRAWAILEWIDENIKYNYTKANLVDELVYNWEALSEYERELYATLTRLQAANDTIYRKSGICTDYAILTAALLLESNISPVYMLDISYKNKDVGHATVAIKIDGEYFVLDQHVPMKPIGNYYWSSLEGTGEITNITFYAVRLDKNGELVIYSNWTWTGEQIKEMTYTMTEVDINLIIELTKQKFLELYPYYTEDERLKQNAEKDLESIKLTDEPSDATLPYGFTKGWILWWYDNYFTLYYHPAIAEKLVEEYWPIPAFLEEGWKETIGQCDKFYLIIDTDENNRIVIKDSTGNIFKIPRVIMVVEVAK